QAVTVALDTVKKSAGRPVLVKCCDAVSTLFSAAGALEQKPEFVEAQYSHRSEFNVPRPDQRSIGKPEITPDVCVRWAERSTRSDDAQLYVVPIVVEPDFVAT